MKKFLSLLLALMMVFAIAATAAAAPGEGEMEDPYAPVPVVVEEEEEDFEIDEDETPLDELSLFDPETPKTGDNSSFWFYAALLSGVSLLAVSAMHPKKDESSK